ncbi:multidrug ABC transporter ATP-binding protein [Streptococcus cuniculi]|uniref:Multidrug ABC transporter ATP-binding protein n=1 Tax=Streptococcus cuniculi TaxID=1432788 RepID=A0A1Q8EAI4_9STRE|nr:ABC transporter ATP-binding protein [Streptococcus cuniculi]OLF48800.1 multidrug ABC transporter ATP-binding protein [Streptococcus cuniculi]
MLAIKDLSYTYAGMSRQQIFQNLNYQFEEGTFYSIVGHSGAGKTTLLSLLAGLDQPTSGQLLLNGKDVREIGYQTYRRHHVSLVFQNYNLLDYLTPLENIRLVNKKADPKVLLDLGLSQEQINRNILQLSGGQQQRVAIARSLVSGASIMLLDEPTGNLDEEIAVDIVEHLKTIAHEEGKCVIMVTHSKALAGMADVQLTLRNGQFRS